MKVIVAENYEEAAKKAADLIEKVVRENPACTLGLATGSSPVGMYRELSRRCREEGLDFSGVHSVNRDEYVGLDGSHDQSYRYFMNSNLFDHINIDKANTYVAKGTGDIEANLKEFNAVLDSTERAAFRKEINYAHRAFFPDSLNFYAPYYHQATMNGLLDSLALEYLALASSELCRDFDYYMQHFNGGRPFILAGFSQGGMMVLELLRHMSEEQYSRLVAAYLIGCGLNADDLSHAHIVAAQGALDTGVCVSFNTVSDTCGIWQLAYRDAVTCINPVTWSTDSAPADFYFPGRGKIPAQDLTVAIDPEAHVLVVPDFVSEATPYWSAQCLHHFDILFYSDFIRRNALDRAYR